MPKAKITFRSYRYRCFADQFSELGHLHWIFSYAMQMSDEHLSELLGNQSHEIWLHDVRPIMGLTDKRLGLKVSEFHNRQSAYIGQLRLLLLVKACAALEDYLHYYIEYYAAFLGYKTLEHNKLNEVGQALIKPGTVNNLSNCVNYIDQLMNLKLGNDLKEKIYSAYQTRCAAAHNGGIIDRETKKKAKIFENLPLGTPINLSWDTLNDYLIAINTIAGIVDQVVPERQLGHIECLWLIAEEASNDKVALEQIKNEKKKQEKKKKERAFVVKLRQILFTDYHYPLYVPSEKEIYNSLAAVFTR